MRFSIITTVHNAEKYILKNIESVQMQTFKDFEHFIIDDCSTDKTWQVIESIKNKKKEKGNYEMLYPSSTETLDDRRFVFVQSLSPGEYVYEYFIRARTVGTFTGYPAIVSELYSPEVFGRSGGTTVTIKK